jgi:hypothetical protein
MPERVEGKLKRNFGQIDQIWVVLRGIEISDTTAVDGRMLGIMKTNTARNPVTGIQSDQFESDIMPERGFSPVGVRHPVGENGGRSLRMYTEQQVSAMLQVSLSQLRKWRMKQNRHSRQGPPFKKIGRLVRYPEQGLLDYINGR